MKEEIQYFENLKDAIAKKLRCVHPSAPKKLTDWKVKDIADFQSDLEEKINERVSEKWIYTHLKGSSSKLPREDMLDILARYVGNESWQNWLEHATQKNSKFPVWMIGLTLLVAIGILVVVLLNIQSATECEICFVDSERQALVLDSPVEFYLHSDKETPRRFKADSNACVRFSTSRETIRFSIKSPYYKTDTIIRFISSSEGNYSEKISLKTNDYALMIHVFSNSKIQDWKRRRNQLDGMIADDAQIYQIFEEENMILDLYNKWDFINKLTTPTRSLKNIHVINTEYKNGKIYLMRFKLLSNPQEIEDDEKPSNPEMNETEPT